MTNEAKPTNPKDRIGITKLPLELLPPTAMAVWSLAQLDGALKYGTWNWRIAGVRASIYAAAAMRHIECWFHGENLDPDSGVHNLGHAMACLAIIIDAEAVGKLTDDRAPSIDLRAFFNNLNLTVKELRALRKDCNPRHYGIADDIKTTQPEPVQIGNDAIELPVPAGTFVPPPGAVCLGGGAADERPRVYDTARATSYVPEGGPLVDEPAVVWQESNPALTEPLTEPVSVGRVYHDNFGFKP